MKMQPIMRAAIAAAALMVACATHAAGGSFVCKDNLGTLKEIEAQVGGSSGFIKIVSQYVSRWDAPGGPAALCGLRGGRACEDHLPKWSARLERNQGVNTGRLFRPQQLASANAAEREKGNGYREAIAYCRSVRAIK